jgi:hypothetical protein
MPPSRREYKIWATSGGIEPANACMPSIAVSTGRPMLRIRARLVRSASAAAQ